jgi:cytosine/adenosine deaminase-related metal-dependent hydrolase
MRLLTADYIFPISQAPLKNGYLLLDDQNTIVSVVSKDDWQNSPYKHLNPEKHEGIICPGFINSHCHLELSYLKNAVPKQQGLAKFVVDLQRIRHQFNEAEINLAIQKADLQMQQNGIVAVGDISNGATSFKTKAVSKIKYYNFIELFGFDQNKAEETYNSALDLKDKLLDVCGDNAAFSIVPHAPYSVSRKLFKKIGDEAYQNNYLISMHNQETEDENLLFQSKKGALKDMLEQFGLDLSQWQATGFDSMPSVVSQLPKCVKMLLVHNTFTNQKNIEWARDYSKLLWWCFCPKANLYIENKLPDFSLFTSFKNRLVVGTDSLASNTELSILEELKTIQNHSKVFVLQDLLAMATQNAAAFFEFKDLGSFDKGKKPGVNLISQVDLEKLMLRENSCISVLA